MSNGLIMRVVIKSKQKMKNSIECLKYHFKNDANEKRGLMSFKKLKQSPEALPLMNGGLKIKRCTTSNYYVLIRFLPL